jgi:hypothetical protein
MFGIFDDYQRVFGIFDDWNTMSAYVRDFLANIGVTSVSILRQQLAVSS